MRGVSKNVFILVAFRSFYFFVFSLSVESPKDSKSDYYCNCINIVLENKIIDKYICQSIWIKEQFQRNVKEKNVMCRSNNLYFLSGRYELWLKDGKHCKLSWIIILYILVVMTDFLSPFDTLVSIF